MLDAKFNPFHTRLDPVQWHPPDPPELEGPLEPNRELTGGDCVVTLDGPEDVAFDEHDHLYTGTADGYVYRTVEPVRKDTTEADVMIVARTGGRPLAVEFAGRTLYVAAIDVGLLSIAPDGTPRTLVERAGDRDIGFANDVCVTDDATVYFTDSSRDGFFKELYELRDTGRLLAYHPTSGETTVELENLGFANGVAVGPRGESLLIAEMTRYRVTRYWIRGENAGETEVFVENLPGLPDNIDADDTTYWLAVPSLRNALLDRLHRHPWLVRQFGRLPKIVYPQLTPEQYGLVLRLDADGEIIESLHDPSGTISVTSATPHDDALYLGTESGHQVTRYPLG